MTALSRLDRVRLARCAARLRDGADLGTETEWLADTLDRLASKEGGFEWKISELRQICRELGVVVAPGELIDSRGLARLIDLSEGTLRNWRSRNCSPIRRTVIAGRPKYALSDVAAYLIGQTS